MQHKFSPRAQQPIAPATPMQNQASLCRMFCPQPAQLKTREAERRRAPLAAHARARSRQAPLSTLALFAYYFTFLSFSLLFVFKAGLGGGTKSGTRTLSLSPVEVEDSRLVIPPGRVLLLHVEKQESSREKPSTGPEVVVTWLRFVFLWFFDSENCSRT